MSVLAIIVLAVVVVALVVALLFFVPRAHERRHLRMRERGPGRRSTPELFTRLTGSYWSREGAASEVWQS